jgi:hypothetical protein
MDSLFRAQAGANIIDDYAAVLLFVPFRVYRAMSMVNERRTGSDRRLSKGHASFTCAERRFADRRQMNIEDISFFEWARHFASFQRGLVTQGVDVAGDGRQAAAKDDEGQKQ